MITTTMVLTVILIGNGGGDERPGNQGFPAPLLYEEGFEGDACPPPSATPLRDGVPIKSFLFYYCIISGHMSHCHIVTLSQGHMSQGSQLRRGGLRGDARPPCEYRIIRIGRHRWLRRISFIKLVVIPV